MPQESSRTADDLYYAAIDHLADGRPAAAVDSFRAALALQPSCLDARHGLILALDAAGLIDEGIAAALQLTADQPDDVLAWTNLSILYQHAGRISDAEAASARAKILGWKQELQTNREGRAAE
jgi:tetratricopeptide (TPR) repeat protein